MNSDSKYVSFSPVKCVGVYPGRNDDIHRYADNIESIHKKRAVLALSFFARPLDHVEKSILLGLFIPISHIDAIFCDYKRKNRVKLASRVVILTPLQIPRIPIECTLYFLFYGAKVMCLNLPSTLAALIKPQEKVEAYFSKRNLRESNLESNIMDGIKIQYKIKSNDHETYDVYKTIMLQQYDEYDNMKAYRQKWKNRLKFYNLPFNPCRALCQMVTFKIFSY